VSGRFYSLNLNFDFGCFAFLVYFGIKILFCCCFRFFHIFDCVIFYTLCQMFTHHVEMFVMYGRSISFSVCMCTVWVNQIVSTDQINKSRSRRLLPRRLPPAHKLKAHNKEIWLFFLHPFLVVEDL